VLCAPLAALLLRVRRAAWPWAALAVLAVVRPAPLGRAAAALGGGDPMELERVASAAGTTLLMAGASLLLAVRTRLLVC